jgi:hypothetical protein
MQYISPYREERPLSELIPPDRRRLRSFLVAFGGILLGAVLLRAAEEVAERRAGT